MKVIVVEVTRAANSFGLTHGDRIREAYTLMGDVVAKAQEDGAFRSDVTPRFAALAFYGIIEQVLTGWIFDPDPIARGGDRGGQGPRGRGDRRRPRGARHPPGRSDWISGLMDNDVVKRLVWAGLLAGLGALASILTTRVAALVWRRLYGEDPPE